MANINTRLIPEGWRIEEDKTRGIATIVSNDGGVTINFQRRTFWLGFSDAGRPSTTEVFSGRRWKDKLVTTAVKHLQDIWES